MGADSFRAPRNRKAVQQIINRFAKKFGIRIYRQAINSNHIHLLLRITNRVLYRAFIKAISGKIASQVMSQQSFKLFSEARTKAELGLKKTLQKQLQLPQPLQLGDGSKALVLSQRFWQFRPFSRVVNWGRDFKMCANYLKQNILEAIGFIPYASRKNYYSTWLKETVPDVGVLQI